MRSTFSPRPIVDIVVVIIVFILAFFAGYKTASADEELTDLRDPVFNGFSLDSNAFLTHKNCLERGGKWEGVAKDELPVLPPRVNSGAHCIFESQETGEAKDTSTEFIRPKSISFIFDHANMIEVAAFVYEFPTWAARDHARKSMIRNMHKFFPLTATKLKTDQYQLNNLHRELFLELVTYDEPAYMITNEGVIDMTTSYIFTIGFSREKLEDYLFEEDLQKELEKSISNDPLDGLDIN